MPSTAQSRPGCPAAAVGHCRGGGRSRNAWDELLLAIDCPAEKIKILTTEIEETHPIGRLFDMDVIDTDGQKLSRPSYRKCIICGCQAQECARTRKHTVEEMQAKIEEMLEKRRF